MKCTKTMLIGLLCLMVGSSTFGEEPAPKYAVRAGKIVTMRRADSDSGTPSAINHGVILISDGRIEAIGPAADVDIPNDYVIIDASDRWVMPGIVEAHSHIGTEGGWNDMVVPLNPELWIGDGVDPESLEVKEALAGGVTTVHTMPGSGTNFAGFTVIIKLHGDTPEEMIFKKIGAMKISNAFNPERRGGDLGRTRAGMSWMLGHILARGQVYAEMWRRHEDEPNSPAPAIEPEWELMRQVFEGKIPVIVHTCKAWGVMQAIRLFGDEYGLTVIPTHTPWGGYFAGREARRRDNVHINIGPRLLSTEYADAGDRGIRGMGAEYSKRGVTNLSINTDAPVVPQEEIRFQAAMSARFGLDEMVAMQAITINSARALGIDDRVGSLEVGKDADLVIKTGSLLDVATPVDMVLINGRIAHERKGAALQRIFGQDPALTTKRQAQ